MRETAKWFIVQVFGGIGTAASLDWSSMDLSITTMVNHADVATWFAATMVGYPILDFLFRATDDKQANVCIGNLNLMLVGVSILMLVFFAIVFGMTVIVEPSIVAERLKVQELATGYLFLWLGATAVSFVYVLRLEAVQWLRG